MLSGFKINSIVFKFIALFVHQSKLRILELSLLKIHEYNSPVRVLKDTLSVCPLTPVNNFFISLDIIVGLCSCDEPPNSCIESTSGG